MLLEKKTKMVGNGEMLINCILLFPQNFLPSPKQISIFESYLFYLFFRLQMLSIWTSLKFCPFSTCFINLSKKPFEILQEKEKMLVTRKARSDCLNAHVNLTLQSLQNRIMVANTKMRVKTKNYLVVH